MTNIEASFKKVKVRTTFMGFTVVLLTERKYDSTTLYGGCGYQYDCPENIREIFPEHIRFLVKFMIRTNCLYNIF